MEENHDHLLQAPKAAIGYEDNLEGDRGGREGRVQAHGGGLRTTMSTVASVGEGLKRRASGKPEKPRQGALHDPLGHDDEDAFRELDECFHNADGLMPRVSREEDLVYLGGKGGPALFALHHQGQAGMSPPLHESGDLNVSGSEGEKLSNRGVFLTGKEAAKLRSREPLAGDTVSRGETGGDIHRTESASSDQTSGCDSHASSISTGATALSKKRPWKPEEDEYLRALVHRQGARDWGQIAEHFENRNGKQCHQRWNYFLSPTVHSGAWTAEEDEKIVNFQCLLGNKWARIATHIPGRTGHAVKNRAHQIANKMRKRERKRARSQGWVEGKGGAGGRGKKTGPSHAPPAVDGARSTRRAQGYPNPNPDLFPGPTAGALAQGGEEDSVTEACSGSDSGGGTTCSTTSSSSSSAVAAPGHTPGSGHNHHHHHHHHHHNLHPQDVAETAGPLGMGKALSGGNQGAGKTKIPPETHGRGGSSAFISASLGPPVASTAPKRASPPSREEHVPALDTAEESLPGESPCAATALSSTALSLAVPLTVGGVQHFLTAQSALAQHRGEERQWADGTDVPPILYHEGVAYVPVATTTLPSPCGPPPSASSVKSPTVGQAGPMRAWEAAKKNVICLERLTEHQALMQHHLRLQQQRLTMERRREEAVVNEACGLVDLDGLPVADHEQESAGSGGARNIIHHHHHDDEQQEQDEDEEAEAKVEAEVGGLDLLHRHYHHHHHHHHPAGGGDEEEEDLAIVPPTFEEDGL